MAPVQFAEAGGGPPSEEDIAFAKRTSDLLLATLFAALTQEFDETTPGKDHFERKALEDALDGGQPRTDVQHVDGAWFYRRSIPLSVFRTECALCHTNFAGLGPNDWVGALMLKVPIP